MLLMLIGAMTALTASSVVALALENSSRNFRSLEELDAAIGLPSLGLVPLLKENRLATARRASRSAYYYGEAIRTIYASLSLQLSRTTSKVLVVTSALPCEGKTNLVLSLAAIAARCGRRTLLVDGDLRKGGLTARLNLNGRPGFAELLAGRTSLESAISTDPHSGLDVMAAGRTSPHEGGIVAAGNLSGLLATLSQRYELILLDSPPVLAISDGLILAAHADATIVAIRWASTTRPAVKLAIKRLREAGSALTGTVLTMVYPRQHARYGYPEAAYFSSDARKYYSADAPLPVLARATESS